MDEQIAVYNWWGSNENSPPAHLKTKRQLYELGLRPLVAVGIIHCRDYNCALFDPTNPKSVKPKRKSTQKQLDVLAANRENAKRKRAYEEWLRDYGFIECDRAAAVRWAREILSQGNWTILDTETTGLGDAEVIEIAIINLMGEPLLDTLIKPTIPIPPDSCAIHGITDLMVNNAPQFSEVYPQIMSVLKDKEVLIYNSSFDIRVLNYTRKINKLPPLGLRERQTCVMEWYSQWCGDWSYYWKDYRWQKLPGGGHRAISDCIATLEVIKQIAQDNPEIEYPIGIYPPQR